MTEQQGQSGRLLYFVFTFLSSQDDWSVVTNSPPEKHESTGSCFLFLLIQTGTGAEYFHKLSSKCIIYLHIFAPLCLQGFVTALSGLFGPVPVGGTFPPVF